MLFSSIKETNRLIRKGMSNIYLSYYATFKLESLFYKVNTCLLKTTTCIGSTNNKTLLVVIK